MHNIPLRDRIAIATNVHIHDFDRTLSLFGRAPAMPDVTLNSEACVFAINPTTSYFNSGQITVHGQRNGEGDLRYLPISERLRSRRCANWGTGAIQENRRRGS